MAKELCSRRIQCIRILNSNPKDFINGLALNLGPNPSPKTFPAILGKFSFYAPGPSQWAQATCVRKWSHGPPGSLADGLILALEGFSNPRMPWPMAHGM
ncbi:hypothetical protein O181_097573 [Austropuccinia psidii MF-1]|uniref:Uncharacterized protein n=1 Tax=Austropuccinia psidii MF-1 TaxID=1389203 RepID=A0A9Q3J7Q2_9BASI|nr:hypothetical protein [Austropuccinia psidii MF-1]